MKLRLLKAKHWLLITLLGMLGLSSCEKQKDMYENKRRINNEYGGSARESQLCLGGVGLALPSEVLPPSGHGRYKQELALEAGRGTGSPGAHLLAGRKQHASEPQTRARRTRTS